MASRRASWRRSWSSWLLISSICASATRSSSRSARVATLAERRVHAAPRAASKRLPSVSSELLGAHLGERLLDALGDLGKALVEPRWLDRAAGAARPCGASVWRAADGSDAQRRLRSLRGGLQFALRDGLRLARGSRRYRRRPRPTRRSWTSALAAASSHGFERLLRAVAGPPSRITSSGARARPRASSSVTKRGRLGARRRPTCRPALYGTERAAAQLRQALAQALHLLLDALHVGLELVRNLRSDRAGLVAQRGQPIAHLVAASSPASVARTHGRGIGARAIDFVIGLVRHLYPLALVDEPRAGRWPLLSGLPDRDAQNVNPLIPRVCESR